MKLLEVNNLEFTYGKNTILKDLNFFIKAGSFVSIIGPNGSGKSTLLKNLNNILEPSKGTVLLKGEDISSYSRKELAKEIALVPQNSSVNYDFTIEEIVMMGRHPHKGRFEGENERDYELVNRAMDLTNVSEFKDSYITEVSGGEQQRVMIARAIAQDSETIFLDEPTSNLDINHQIEILDFLKKLNEREGKTIILVIHDINLAARYSDEIILLCNGEILDSGSPEEVITKANIERAYRIKAAVDINEHTKTTYLTPLEKI